MPPKTLIFICAALTAISIVLQIWALIMRIKFRALQQQWEKEDRQALVNEGSNRNAESQDGNAKSN